MIIRINNTELFKELLSQAIDADKQTTHHECKCGCKSQMPTITKVTFNGPATIVKWSDNTITKSICHRDDELNYEFGLMVAINKKFLKMSGIKHFDKFYSSILDNKNNYITKNKAVIK